MLKKLAIIENGVVINSIVWNDDEEFVPDEGILAVFDETVGRGWTYADGVFTPPVSPEEPA